MIWPTPPTPPFCTIHVLTYMLFFSLLIPLLARGCAFASKQSSLQLDAILFFSRLQAGVTAQRRTPAADVGSASALLSVAQQRTENTFLPWSLQII